MKQYLTIHFADGFSSLVVKEHLKQYGAVFPCHLSQHKQIWRIEAPDLSIDDMDDVAESLPLEWQVLDAFASDKVGNEV